MSSSIKTLDGWNKYTDRTGRKSISDYLNVGDIVSDDMFGYFLNIMPPRSLSYGYLQVGEAYDYVYDVSRQLRPIYMTFAKANSYWRYYGNCFVSETIDKSYR